MSCNFTLFVYCLVILEENEKNVKRKIIMKCFLLDHINLT
jgi:hypothetical protein